MLGNLYLKAQEEKLTLEKHYRNKGERIRSMENNMSKDTKVSCTHSSWHGMASSLTQFRRAPVSNCMN